MMPRYLQMLRWGGRGILSVLLALVPLPGPLAQHPSDPPGAPTVTTPLENDWLQTLASLFGPALTTAIRQGRERAYPHGQTIPEAIHRTLAPFFPLPVLQKVRYSTTWRDEATQDPLYSVLLGTGANAVTLIDVIIFRDAHQAADPVLWAHELTHVEQYDRLGVEAFAEQYLQQGWMLEQEAYTRADTIKRQLAR
jgi:hypothetical protein